MEHMVRQLHGVKDEVEPQLREWFDRRFQPLFHAGWQKGLADGNQGFWARRLKVRVSEVAAQIEKYDEQAKQKEARREFDEEWCLTLERKFWWTGYLNGFLKTQGGLRDAQYALWSMKQPWWVWAVLGLLWAASWILFGLWVGLGVLLLIMGGSYLCWRGQHQASANVTPVAQAEQPSLPPPPSPERLRRIKGGRGSWDGFVMTLGGVVIALGMFSLLANLALIDWWPFILIGLGLFILVRAVRRKRRDRAA